MRGAEIPNTDRPTRQTLRLLHGAFFTDPSRMRNFSERTVGTLIRHDEDEAGRLQTTFWTYQRANCNMNVAAEWLETHRHTVANRLRRIRELTGLDPQRGYDPTRPRPADPPGDRELRAPAKLTAAASGTALGETFEVPAVIERRREPRPVSVGHRPHR